MDDRTRGREAPRCLGRRDALKLAAGGVLAAFVPGCAAEPPLRVALQPWCGYQFIRLAEKEGWLPPDINLVHKATATESVDALRRGEVEAAALTLDEVLRLVDGGMDDLQVLLICDVSAGADVVLARPGIASPAGLRGKRIGVESTSLGRIMVAKLLESAELGPADVHVVPMDENHLRAWDTQQLDAVLTYEPARSQLEALGLQPIFDSRQLPQTVLDVVAARRGTAVQHQRQLTDVIGGHFRALALWRENPIDAAYSLAPYIGVTPAEVARAYRGIDLPDLEYNRHYLQGPAKELLSSVSDVAQIMLEAGLLRRAPAVQNLFTADFLPGPS